MPPKDNKGLSNGDPKHQPKTPGPKPPIYHQLSELGLVFEIGIGGFFEAYSHPWDERYIYLRERLAF